jgi:hypothetical protein
MRVWHSHLSWVKLKINQWPSLGEEADLWFALRSPTMSLLIENAFIQMQQPQVGH